MTEGRSPDLDDEVVIGLGRYPEGSGFALGVAKLTRLGLPALGAFVVFFGVWEGLTRLLEVKSFILPKPTEIMESFAETTDVILEAGFNTLQEALGGFVIGTVLGVLVALVAVRWTFAGEGLMPFAIAANAMPILAIAPIANAMFGFTGQMAKMAVAGVVVFFPVMINTARGLTDVDPAQLELMRSFAATPGEIMRRVRIPNALPYFFSALKIGTALSLIAAIVAEYFGGRQNVLGQYILNRAFLLNYPDAWAAIAVASAMGIALYVMVLVVERLVMPWHSSFRTDPV